MVVKRCNHQGSVATNARLVPSALGLGLAIAVLWFVRIEVTQENLANATSLTLAYEFDHVKWFGAGFVLLLWATFLAFGLIGRRADPLIAKVDLFVGAFFAFAAASFVWSPDETTALQAGLHGLLLLFAYVLTRLTAEQELKRLIGTFAHISIAGTFVVSLLVSESKVFGGLGNENFLAEFLLVMCGLASVTVFGERGVVRTCSTLVVGSGLGYLIVFAPSNLQFVGLTAIAVYFLAWAQRWRTFGFATSILVIGAFTVFLWILEFDGLHRLPINALDRMQIWTNAAIMFLDQPVLGRGLGSFFHDFGVYSDRFAGVFPHMVLESYGNYARQPSGADSEPLDLLVRLGVVGGAIAFSILFGLYRTCLFTNRSGAGPLGISITAGLAVGTVSLTFANAATMIPLSLAAGWIVNYEPERSTKLLRIGSRFSRVLGLSVALLIIPVLVLTQRDVIAGKSFSRALAYDEKGDTVASAESLLHAIRISDTDPRLRIMAYTQTIIAGPEFRQANSITVAQLESMFRRARDASPDNPLLLDIRLKSLLSQSGLTLDLAEIENMLNSLKKTTGRSNANAHILEAALAVQLKDGPRATAALSTAEALVRDPPGQNDAANLANIKVLKEALGQLRQMRN